MLQQLTGHAAEYAFPQARMTIAANDQQVGANVRSVTEQGVGRRNAGQRCPRCLGANAVTGEVASNVGADGIIDRWLSSYRVRLQNGDRCGLSEKRNRVVDRSRRLTAVIPADENVGAANSKRPM